MCSFQNFFLPRKLRGSRRASSQANRRSHARALTFFTGPLVKGPHRSYAILFDYRFLSELRNTPSPLLHVIQLEKFRPSYIAAQDVPRQIFRLPRLPGRAWFFLSPAAYYVIAESRRWPHRLSAHSFFAAASPAGSVPAPHFSGLGVLAL